MKIKAAVFSLGLVLAAGCGGSKPVKPKPDFDAVKTRAGQAHKDLKIEETGESGPQLAPESEPVKAKVLSKDIVKGCTWIESQSVVTAGDQDSRHQVKAAAVAEAEKNAMQDFLGVEVKSRFLLFQQEGLREEQSLTESLLQTTRLGRILDETVLAEGFQDIKGCPACRFQVKLKACIVPIPDSSDKDFKAELGLSRTRFVEGDEAVIRVTTNRDCYVYVYDVDPDKNTSLIVPNEIVSEVKLKAGEAWTYPNESVRSRGVKLVAQLPEAHNVSAETIRLVASKTPLPMKMEDPAVGGYLSVLRRLSASRLEWTEDAQAFTIYKH
ncbi:MAG: DUF4384 domain-containing protein [Elusimicrobia bacterium]|nr:DUF4384 domain-containing protein [Elusimicrobiota bacterium]